MSTRVRINLGVFALLFLVLLWWDITNVLRPDAITHPYKVSAEFTTSPGLRSGFGVTYLGVQVGELGSVKLVDGHVRAELKIDHGVKLPAKLDAAVRRKSVVGEPYVDLRPTDGTDPGGPRLQAGAVIPLTRTTTPLEYSTLFNSVGRLLDAVPTEDLKRLLDAVAAGVEGRGDDFRRLISSADELTSTLAKNSPLLDQVADDLTTFTHNLAAHREALGAGFDNVASLSQTLATNKDKLVGLLQHTPSLLADVDSLLRTAGPSIGCTVDSAGSLFHTLDTPGILGAFKQLIDLSPTAAQIVGSIGYQGPDGPYIGGALVFSASGSPPRVFRTPLALPAVTPVPACNVPGANGAGGSGANTAPGQGGAGATGDHSVETPAKPGEPTPSFGPSSRKPAKGTTWRTYLWPALIGLAVLAALLLVTMVRPWERLRGLLGAGAGAAAASEGADDVGGAMGQHGAPDAGDAQQLDPPGGDTEGPP